VTQRGNRRQRTFFGKSDYRAYIDLMAEWCHRYGIAVWAYCLMPNHAHLVVVPCDEDGLRLGIGEAHRRYTHRINFRKGWRGHLWQGRFGSCVMDEPHLLAAVRYVEMNPVRAHLVERPEDWPWSSTAAHLVGTDDALVQAGPMLERVCTRVADWRAYLDLETPGETIERLRLHERTGRPLGGPAFLDALEALLGGSLRPGKPGRPRTSTPGST
jgi:putative transposase